MESSVNGVRTTGIYCRDGCSGRPHERNVSRFRSGIAAEAAGYRPCLRCRPDRLPPFVDGPGDGIVAHALLLIADGALDRDSEAVFARRFGVTERHLRRLFHDHVGATPAMVARSRRAHFARRLLDETDLRILDVAYASGFNGARQMDRVVRAVFRFTPRELRARRRASDRSTADGGLRLQLAYRGPLGYDAMLRYLTPRAVPGVESVREGVYRRTMTSCGDPGVIEIADAGDDTHLVVVAHLPTLGSLIDDVARCRRLFGLDRPASADTHLADNPVLRSAVEAHPGLRVPGAWDPFETSVRILLGQQVSVAAATTLSGRLVERFGSAVPGLTEKGLAYVFPPAARIADARLAELRGIGLTSARAESIRAFARTYSDERVRLDVGIPLDELVASLQELPGIGPWTAHMISLRAAGHGDAFPADDLGLRRVAARLSGAPALKASALEDLAEGWRPHRALAAMHLWMAR